MKNAEWRQAAWGAIKGRWADVQEQWLSCWILRGAQDDRRGERYFQSGTTSSLRTQPVWPFSKTRRSQRPSRKDLSVMARAPGASGLVFCAMSASVGIERRVEPR